MHKGMTKKAGWNYSTVNYVSQSHFNAGIPKREVMKKTKGDPVKTKMFYELGRWILSIKFVKYQKE